MRVSDTTTEVGGLLRSLRLSAGLTQHALAERTGVAYRTIQDLERGVGRPRRETLRRLIAVLDPPADAAARLEAASSAPRERARRPGTGAVGINRLPVPASMTTFVGRERELADLVSLLPSCRLLTLTGPGGSGKTRLALEIAPLVTPTYPDGIAFVSLAPLADPSLLAPAIAAALGIQETPSQSVTVNLTNSIGNRRMLLLLDNFEHLLEGSSLIVELLRACTNLTILVTSRALLRLSGEQVYAVPTLTVPDLADLSPTDDTAIAALAECEAVQLFAERARNADPAYRLDAEATVDVARLCTRLDGLPLAIELAAARVRLLPPRAMLARIEHRLPLLTGGARDLPARQQTLGNTIAWSYELLNPAEQRLFRLLAVFAGGCTLAALEAMAAPDLQAHRQNSPYVDAGVLDGIASLVDKSLAYTVIGPDGESRFTMLETIREFVTEQLATSGEAEIYRWRHAHHYADFAETARSHLRGPAVALWLKRFDAEHDNLRAAMDWGAAHPDRLATAGGVDVPTSGIDLASRIAEATAWYWALRSLLRQAREWTKRLLLRAQSGTPAQARLLAASAIVAVFMGDLPEARRFGEQCLEAWRVLGDPYQIAMALGRMANVESYIGDPRWAGSLLDEIEATSNDPRVSLDLEHPLILLRAQAAKQAGDYDAAVRLLERGLALAYADDDPHTIQATLRPLGIIAGQRGDHVTAVRLLAEAARVGASLGDRPCTQGAVAFAAIEAVEIGLPERATPLLGLLTRLWDEAGHRGTGVPGAEAAIERCRAVLGQAAFDAAWAEGRAMTWDEGVAYAVRLEDELPGSPAPALVHTVPIDSSTTSARTRASARSASTGAPSGPSLTPRESEVVRLIAQGLTNRQIAAELVISERTVHSHVYRLLGKLGLSSRAQVAAWAVAQRLSD